MADVVDYIKTIPQGAKVLLLAPLHFHKARSLKEELNVLLQRDLTELFLVVIC
ncbi:MAG: hypothetical protein IPJ79_13735 [Bacteroidetes bacterium]|nr:hypothetical protein [Bacteroidota bacterium]